MATERPNSRGYSSPPSSADTPEQPAPAAEAPPGNQAAVVAEAHGGSRELATVAPGTLAVGAEIGKGRFKRVHRGWHRRFGAVVVLRFGLGSDANELNILKLFATKGGCQNVPKFLGLCGDRVVQEYALWGTLKGALQDEEVRSRLSPAHKRCMATQLARAGSFLQESSIVHADLSCRNILLFWLEDEPKFSIAKVTDFGLAVVLPQGCDFIERKQPQATRWCSPETVSHLKLSHRSDVWSLGATLWEMFANGASPWSRRSRRSDVAARLRDLAENNGTAEGGPDVSRDFPLARNTCGSTVQSIILTCLQADEHARPSFATLAQNFEQVSQVARAPEGLSTGDSDEGSQAASSSSSRIASRKASTVSTTDSVECIAAIADACPAVDVDFQKIRPRRFQKIKDFLVTPPALLALGEDSVHEMLRELDDAQAPDPQNTSCLLARRRSEATTTASSIPSLGGLMSHVALLNAPGGTERVPSAPGGATNEYVVPLVRSSGKWVESQQLPAPDAWTLTHYVPPSLVRRDFATPLEAWTAFAESKKGSPCILRGPDGLEAAAKSWVPSQLKK